MINEKQLAEILSLYKKHGWNLSRVLLSAELEKNLADNIESIFGRSEIVSSQIDAAWFTLPSKHNREAWEIRHLSSAPFALIEIFEPETEDSLKQEKLRELEAQLIEKFK
jgi:hypothetical protein